MKNEYEVRGDVTAIFINRSSGKVMETLISTSDLEKVSTFPNTWTVTTNPATENFYVIGYLKGGNVILQRWIMEPAGGLVVDHINRDTLNNTRDNLRSVTYTANQLNTVVRGIYFRKRYNDWVARVQVNGKRKVIGCYELEEDALKAAKKARRVALLNEILGSRGKRTRITG